ncbi:hypothetical protein TWF506_011002 [Arthrobotrys conoides]|uniref:Uncharacterized protein n=1 Tax=Arthrobotrys conoides TaxID=74498 RepID=A0AAN8N5N6_9PEZI
MARDMMEKGLLRRRKKRKSLSRLAKGSDERLKTRAHKEKRIGSVERVRENQNKRQRKKKSAGEHERYHRNEENGGDMMFGREERVRKRKEGVRDRGTTTGSFFLVSTTTSTGGCARGGMGRRPGAAAGRNGKGKRSRGWEPFSVSASVTNHDQKEGEEKRDGKPSRWIERSSKE